MARFGVMDVLSGWCSLHLLVCILFGTPRNWDDSEMPQNLKSLYYIPGDIKTVLINLLGKFVPEHYYICFHHLFSSL